MDESAPRNSKAVLHGSGIARVLRYHRDFASVNEKYKDREVD